MGTQGNHRLPDDLSGVEERLAASRPEVTRLDLDRIKLRAMSQASRGSSLRKGFVMRSKLVTMLLVLGLVATGGTAGVIAGGNGNNGNAGNGEYKPGKGCGDKNHTHTGPPGNPSNTTCPPK
jgi:hypothetical protein